MAIRIGFVVWEGREHPQWRNLPIPSRIRGPDVIVLSRNRCLKKSLFYPTQTKHIDAQNDRSDQEQFSCDHQKSRFVMVLTSQTRIFV